MISHADPQGRAVMLTGVTITGADNDVGANEADTLAERSAQAHLEAK